MKKLLIGVLAFTLCLGMNSCKKEATPTGDEQTSTEQGSKVSSQTADSTAQALETTDQATTDQASETKGDTEAKGQTAGEPTKAAAELLAKAKADGANWSVDEWKAAFKDFALIEKPLMIELQNIITELVNNPSNVEELKNKNKNLEATFTKISEYYDEFEKFGLSTPNGKIVFEDKDWLNKTQQELGIPDL